MRMGDWVLVISMTLNCCAMLAYAYQGHFINAWYWCAALNLNAAILLGMRS